MREERRSDDRRAPRKVEVVAAPERSLLPGEIGQRPALTRSDVRSDFRSYLSTDDDLRPASVFRSPPGPARDPGGGLAAMSLRIVRERAATRRCQLRLREARTVGEKSLPEIPRLGHLGG